MAILSKECRGEGLRPMCRKKCFVIVEQNADAAAAVVFEICAPWVSASLFHRQPCSVLRRPAVSRFAMQELALIPATGCSANQ
jgi:hypothetical protein